MSEPRPTMTAEEIADWKRKIEAGILPNNGGPASAPRPKCSCGHADTTHQYWGVIQAGAACRVRSCGCSGLVGLPGQAGEER